MVTCNDLFSFFRFEHITHIYLIMHIRWDGGTFVAGIFVAGIFVAGILVLEFSSPDFRRRNLTLSTNYFIKIISLTVIYIYMCIASHLQ